MINSVIVVGPASPREFAGVLQVDKTPAGLGGTPVNELVRGLIGRGIHVSLITTSYDIAGPWSAVSDELVVHVVPGRRRARHRAMDLFAVERRGLTDAIVEAPGQVVHAHWTYEYALAALRDSRPVVVTAHDAPLTILRHHPDPYRVARTLMALRVRQRLTTLTAVSPYMASRWRREMGYRGQIHLTPNSTPGDLMFPEMLPNQEPRILSVANSSTLKNVKRLLEAFASVKDQVRSVTLQLAGPGLGADDPLAEWARMRGLAEGVTFIGPVARRDLPALFAGAAVFVHPSLEESFGLVLLEAMSAGVPVVGGEESGAVPWVLDEGRAGVLVDVKSPASIAGGILRVLAAPPFGKGIAQAGRARAEGVFAPQRSVDAYLTAYEAALEEGSEGHQVQ